MSRNSPKQFAQWRAAQGRPLPAPTLQDRLREEAGKLRRRAASLLDQANTIEAMANELDPPPSAVDYTAKCYCGAWLQFASDQADEDVICHCPRCKTFSEQDGNVVFVYGYGKDKARASANWRERMDSF